MKILIVEDEILAFKKLEMLISKLIPGSEVVGVAKSIDEAVSIIKSTHIDIGFFDIQIEDGLSFDIFNDVQIEFPVVFTTAFNEYAIRAFKLNSIDYLLKPISEKDLKHSLEKYNKLWGTKTNDIISLDVITEIKHLLKGNFKERFTVRIGNKIEILNTSDICYFYSFEKGTYAKTISNKDSLLDNTIENIFPLLNHKHFFKISRKYIVNIQHIKDIYAYSNSRLKINTKSKSSEELIVSREKVKAFKKWLEDN